MAAATATMDDLIASLSGSMHVSQEGYDLKMLQEYLSQHMALPTLPLSPNTTYRPIPGSRSVSSTRKPISLPSSYYAEAPISQPYPSPLSQASFGSYNDDVPSHFMLNDPTPTGQRPNHLRRSSSYGFGCAVVPSSPSTTYSSFESDAFAPVWQQQVERQVQTNQDPWSSMRGDSGFGDGGGQLNGSSFGFGAGQSQWQSTASGSSQSSSGFGAFRPPQGFGQIQHRVPPTPPIEDDEEMDEDCVDAEMEMEEDEEDRVERAMGLSGVDEVYGTDAAEEVWGRGRRKY
ncbi:hypothetical protein IAR55_001510 [Kwoniella newhampshirensis]|uniref:Uncharacterized protein n=1 Tax=Kwoniella newhampshirensis TaxID=1651941 RepID=A0AAW0Z2B2_9TREE